MADTTMRLRIYGVRGSHPPTKASNTKYGVNTTCLRIDLGDHLIIFDAGTGIINLGHDLMVELKDAGNHSPNLWKLNVLFTHFHIDHLMGFSYFVMNYLPKTEFHFLYPRMINYDLKDVLEELMNPALFPVTLSELPSTRHYYEIGEGKVIYFFEDGFKIYHVSEAEDVTGWQGRISCRRFYTHPKSGSYTYKIESSAGKSIVFATDVEGFVGSDQRLLKFAQGADILIHDAQYTLQEYEIFQGFGHSTYEMACKVAKEANVKKLLLFHHDPKHDDKVLKEIEDNAQKLFSETYMANEDMDFKL
jgi:ribonuclease BN (tRNA processing enzyme)